MRIPIGRQKLSYLFWSLVIFFLMAGPWAIGIFAQTPEAATNGEPEANMSVWAMRRWSPYVVGFFIGVLSWLAFLLSDKPIGVSSAYAKTSGMIETKIRGPAVKEMEYYRQYVPRIDWEWMLVVGLIIGAFVSAQVSGDFRFEWVPPLWEASFGYTWAPRLFTALAGGIIMGIGARWASGCTSGHGISGTLQLVVSSWISLICFFIGGIIIAFIIY